MRPNFPLLLGMLVATALPSVPAWADAIDGHWCSGDGRQVTIQGPSITTPGGTQMQGAYSRHSFSYVTPANEPEAGKDVSMQLLGETAVTVRVGSGSPGETWRRCTATTS